MIEPSWLSIFVPVVLFCPSITHFVLFAPLPLKTTPKGVILLTLRTTMLNECMIHCTVLETVIESKTCDIQ